MTTSMYAGAALHESSVKCAMYIRSQYHNDADACYLAREQMRGTRKRPSAKRREGHQERAML